MKELTQVQQMVSHHNNLDFTSIYVSKKFCLKQQTVIRLTFIFPNCKTSKKKISFQMRIEECSGNLRDIMIFFKLFVVILTLNLSGENFNESDINCLSSVQAQGFCFC